MRMLWFASFYLREPSKLRVLRDQRPYLTGLHRNVNYYTAVPQSSIVSADVEIHKTFLDTIGRTALIIKARNLVDDFRDRELIVSYDVPFMVSIRKPLVVFGSMVATFVTAYVIGGVELKFSSGKSA